MNKKETREILERLIYSPGGLMDFAIEDRLPLKQAKEEKPNDRT